LKLFRRLSYDGSNIRWFLHYSHLLLGQLYFQLQTSFIYRFSPTTIPAFYTSLVLNNHVLAYVFERIITNLHPKIFALNFIRSTVNNLNSPIKNGFKRMSEKVEEIMKLLKEGLNMFLQIILGNMLYYINVT